MQISVNCDGCTLYMQSSSIVTTGTLCFSGLLTLLLQFGEVKSHWVATKCNIYKWNNFWHKCLLEYLIFIKIILIRIKMKHDAHMRRITFTSRSRMTVSSSWTKTNRFVVFIIVYLWLWRHPDWRNPMSWLWWQSKQDIQVLLSRFQKSKWP